MASLSLPRVLQLKKNSLDAEREQFEKFQSIHINKAVNSVEMPVKEKHVRKTIIGTFNDRGGPPIFWAVSRRLPLQENRIVAWKFCHVTHKILREGHSTTLDDGPHHLDFLYNLGKLWVHLREGYGKLIHLYTNLLTCKIKFHARNVRFPGNMQLTADELDAIAENDVNNYFQLCVELFDYMDEILNLQAAVFDSLGNARANSMTASGQCRLAALIPCAQDASQIYDSNVQLLFRLHAALPADTLAGHRERFRQQFKKLSLFYKHASSLQYYRNLLTLPVLPTNPPNFLQQSELGTYVTPVVSVPEPAPDEPDAVGALIDTSDTASVLSAAEPPEEPDRRDSPHPPDPLLERDALIHHLQTELKRMRSEVSQLVQERNSMLGSMRQHCVQLESQLHTTQTELEEEKQKGETLATQTPEIKQKLTETEEKVKVQDEKFQKLKGAYTHLREEHIALIRQKAEVDKLSATLRATAAQHESAKMQLQQELSDRLKDVEILQQSSSSNEEIEAYQNQISNLRSELEQSRQKEIELNTVKASLEALEIEHKTAKTEQEDKINTISIELKETTEFLERIKQEKEDQETELTRVKEELVGLREKSGDEYKKVLEEREDALKQVTELTLQHQQEKQELTLQMCESIDKLKVEIDELQHKLKETENNYVLECEKLNEELTNKHNEFDENLFKKDGAFKDALFKATQLEHALESIKTDYEEQNLERSAEVQNLQQNIDDLVEYKTANEVLVFELTAERDAAISQLKDLIDERNKMTDNFNERSMELDHLRNFFKDMEIRKNQEINKLKEELATSEHTYNTNISVLKSLLDEKSEYGDKQKSERDTLFQKIVELEAIIHEKNKEITESNAKLDTITVDLETLRINYENERKEAKYEIAILQDKLHNVLVSKDEIINNMKSMVAEKDSQVISFNVQCTKLSEEVARLTEELEESQAELEIGKNEFLVLREEHEGIVRRNEANLLLKNEELQSLYDKIKELNKVKIQLENEKDKNNKENDSKIKVLENNIVELNEKLSMLSTETDTYKNEKTSLITLLNEEISNLKSKCEHTLEINEEIKLLNDHMQKQEVVYQEELAAKNEAISRVESDFEQIKSELENIQKLQAKEKEEVDFIISEKDKDKQILEARLQHTEDGRLNAECELQDLLQHNTVLEADLASLKIQLEEARMKIDDQSTKLVTCAGEAALEVTNDALAALERSNAQDSNKAAAELATKALEELARYTQMKGNEERIAKSAISIAHNTAQLSAYVTEVSHISTDMELSDKLNNECRSMLTATKECLESLKKGELSTICTETRGKVRSMASAAVAADTASAGPRTVDDELADMDTAIEEAASQIENMLAASRASDSGIQLEVNEKILDACTTLMGAVKILVQDARRLQNELGDPKTRQKMYRKNPQWSEGLISAAKAVVFAAKLLVTSADEAVGAAGRAEGVWAAAHEVGGATAQLVAASRARAPPAAPALARLTSASRAVAAATGAVLAAVRAAAAKRNDQEALDTSALTLTATRRLEMESKVRSLELECALDAERARLAALRKRHYLLAQHEENGSATNGNE